MYLAATKYRLLKLSYLQNSFIGKVLFSKLTTGVETLERKLKSMLVPLSDMFSNTNEYGRQDGVFQ